MILLADDTNISLSGPNIHELYRIQNTELAKISQWFKLNKNTNFIVFKPKSKCLAFV